MTQTDQLLAADAAANQSFTSAKAGEPVSRCPQPSKYVFDLTLLDEGTPVGAVKYKIVLPEGRTVEGTLDARGHVLVEGLTKKGDVKVSFPDLDTDGDPAEVVEEDTYAPGTPKVLATGVHCLRLRGWKIEKLEDKKPKDEPVAPAEEEEGEWEIETAETVE